MSSCAECMGYQELQVMTKHTHDSTTSSDTVYMYIGRHCCLWCEIATDKLKVPLHTRGYSHPRSLATLKYDHQRFVQNGANVKQVKLYNNVVHQYLWEIPIDQVCK